MIRDSSKNLPHGYSCLGKAFEEDTILDHRQGEKSRKTMSFPRPVEADTPVPDQIPDAVSHEDPQTELPISAIITIGFLIVYYTSARVYICTRVTIYKTHRQL